MSKEIINTADIAEANGDFDGREDGGSLDTDMVATHEAEPAGLSFHVAMRGHTMHDMEALIVEAAALQIVGRYGNDRLKKQIETACVEMVDAKARVALERVTTAIIDQPLTPAFGDKKPVTMREFIGLVGREYLTETVDGEGSPAERGAWRSNSVRSRIEWLVTRALQTEFKHEIEKATNATISAMQAEMRKAHEVMLAEQKARFRDALAKVSA